eukprot:scaffold34083_cov46-Cyclotella_meneghiniana.AAC.2
MEAGEPSEDPYLLCLGDADNGFNGLNRMNSMWEVRHRWPRGAVFVFNIYQHEARLLVRSAPGDEPQVLLSREGVTQGCPMGMLVYGIRLMSLAEDLREAFPEALQPCRGQRYVGGFVGSDMMRERWVAPMVEKCVAGIVELAKVARKYPQSAYVGLTQCLQAEWQYVCRVDPGVGPLLQPVEDALNQQIMDSFRELLGNAVKQGGLAIRNPTVGASRLHQQSVESVDQLVESLVSNGDLDNDGHAATVRAASSKARAERCKAEAARLKELAAGKPKVERRAERITDGEKWGLAWGNSVPLKRDGADLPRVP